MRTRRSYQDPCGIARALDVVGERWALLVVRELLHGPKRFGPLQRGLPGISPNVLSQRLRELEAAGVVARRALAPPVSVTIYELTDRGTALEPVLLALGRWGRDEPSTTDRALGQEALLVALRTTFDPTNGGGADATLDLILDGIPHLVTVVDGDLGIRRGAGGGPPSLSTDSATLRALVFGGLGLADAVAGGDAVVVGSSEVIERLLGAFA